MIYKKELICCKCNKTIKENANYIQFIEWDNKKLINKTQMHKTCWEFLINTKRFVGEAASMIPYLRGAMQEIGLNKIVNVDEVIGKNDK